VKADNADNVEAVCEEYHTQWARIENAPEERRKAKEAEARQLRMEARTEERARWQAEIDQATREADEAKRRAEEAERKLEETRAEWQAEMDRMRAQYERQAV
jgi:dTMP kinase